MISAPVWIRWLFLWSSSAPAEARPRDGHGGPSLRVACPHCTNADTLSRHCADGRCGWVRCTCGALVYSQRRHRHPRHGGAADTCHDPAAAV